MTREPGQPPKEPRVPNQEDAPNPEHWSWEQLRQRIIDSATGIETGLCSFEELPKTLEFGGMFLERIRDLQQHASDTNSERGFDIVVDPGSNRLLLEKNHRHDEGMITHPDGSTSNTVNATPTPFTVSDRVYTATISEQMGLEEALARHSAASSYQQRYKMIAETEGGQLIRKFYRHSVGFAHSHPRRTPFSPQDLKTFLSIRFRRFFPLIDDSGATRLLMSTYETEYIDDDKELESLYELWLQQLTDRINIVTAQWNKAQTVPDELIRSANERFGDKPINFRQMIELELNFRTQRALVKTFAKKRKFGYYEGRDGKLSRVE